MPAERYERSAMSANTTMAKGISITVCSFADTTKQAVLRGRYESTSTSTGPFVPCSASHCYSP